MRKRKSVSLLLVLIALFCLSTRESGFAGQWPSSTLEIVVPWKAGGGSDTLARFIAKIITDSQLISEPVVVVDKPGGNAQIGSAYVMSKKGNPNVWMTLSSAQILSPLAGLGTIKASDTTPLAQMAGDSFMLIAKSDSKFKTIEEVVAAAKANPEGVKVGGTGRGADDHVCTSMLQSAAGVKFNYIAFSGGGEVMTNLLGGHIDLAWANPNECLGQIKGGLLRPLAVTTSERLGGEVNCPTFKEAGYDVVFIQVRGIHGPPDMPKEAIEASIDVLRKVSETESWKKGYIEANYLQPTFIAGDEYVKVIAQNEETAKQALKETGMGQ